MPPCELSIGMSLDCKDSLGGIKKIVLADKTNIDSFTLDANEIVTAILANNANEIYTYELPTQTGSFEETINFNRDNGTVFYTQTVNIMLQKLKSCKAFGIAKCSKSACYCFR